MTKKKVKVKRSTIALNSEVVKLVDEKRGLVKRSTYIDFLLKKQLGLIKDDESG